MTSRKSKSKTILGGITTGAIALGHQSPRPSQRRRRRRRSLRKALMALLAAQIIGLFLWFLAWPVELSFVIPESDFAQWQTSIAAFTETHPKIHIKLITDKANTTEGLAAIYRADFQHAKAQYDLVLMDTVWTTEFSEHLVNLEPLAKRDKLDLSAFLDTDLNAGKINKRLHWLPMYTNIGLLYYRKDWLQEAGLSVPTNMTELSQTIETVKEKHTIDAGYVWQGLSYEGLVVNFIEALGSFGGTWISPDSRQVTLNNNQSIQAAEQLHDFIAEGISPQDVTRYTESDTLEAFENEEALFVRGWPSFWAQLKDDDWQDKVGVTRPFSFTNTQGFGCRGGWGFGISKKTRHRKAAWEAVKYFTGEAGQKQFSLASGLLPTRRSLLTNEEIIAQNYPLMPDMLNYLETGSVLRPAIKDYAKASEILQFSLTQILQGRSATAELKKAQKKTEELLKSK